jgi:hypothetical protein
VVVGRSTLLEQVVVGRSTLLEQVVEGHSNLPKLELGIPRAVEEWMIEVVGA